MTAIGAPGNQTFVSTFDPPTLLDRTIGYRSDELLQTTDDGIVDLAHGNYARGVAELVGANSPIADAQATVLGVLDLLNSARPGSEFGYPSVKDRYDSGFVLNLGSLAATVFGMGTAGPVPGAINVAKSSQIAGGYAADDWMMTRLSAGDKIYGGLPGQSAFYTDASTLSAAQGSRSALFDSLQVKPDIDLGYRPTVGEYEVIEDIKVPWGTAYANPSAGAGGGSQYFVADFAKYLRHVRTIPLGP